MNQVVDEMVGILNGEVAPDELMHYGRKGMKWGQHIFGQYQKHAKYSGRYRDVNYSSDDVVFVSGKVKYDEPIPTPVKRELDRAISADSKIIIGDAPGADTRVQDYLSDVGYKNVTVYTTDKTVRNNVGNWKVETISGNGETEERQIRAQKDIAMSNAATKGIVISSDDDRPDSATSLNISRLLESNKGIQFYDYKKDMISTQGFDDPEDDELMHYGMPRRSGRYPWGSGEDPYQHGRDFLGRVEELKKNKNFTYVDKKGNKYTGDTAIAKSMGLTTTQFRQEIAWANYERRCAEVARAKSLQDKGLGPTKIGEEMGLNESTVRSLLNPISESRMNQARKTADFIKEQVDTKGMIDVGKGVERELGISKEKLDLALYALEREGYKLYKGGIPQVTNPGQQTNQKVICPPGTEHKEIYNFDKVHSLVEYKSHDNGETFDKIVYPKSMDSKRLEICYAEDGGINKDGIVELRRGVKDLSLGDARYSQVRILVDDKKYIKGMAVYADDLPDGIDVRFNTNKSKSVAKLDVLKDIKNDPDNPFGSLIKSQSYYMDDNGKKQLSLINKRADEGDWSDWKDALPSQFLSKQNLNMAKKQLNLAKMDKYDEFDEICSLTNPTIKKHLLQKFADGCDSAAVHLQAAALPGQKYHVIIPINTLKDTEVYAPNYENGTKLALIRYPHGGTFEIPILTVNNKHAAAKKLLGTDVEDAVGITKKVADRLSGADFDGDTVMCIPTHDSKGKVKITSTKPLEDLEDFDPKDAYPERPGMKYMKDPVTGKDSTQMEMGKISNLITDMTLGGATEKELARAVRHSMVVIDAGKHKLDYKQSEKDHNIAALRKDYQMKVDENGNVHYGGASTIISRAKGEYSVLKRQGSPKVNIKGSKDYDPSKPEGALLYKTADDVYYPDRKYDKSTGMMTIRTIDGKKVTYNVSDKKASDLYTPVKRVDEKTGEITYTDKTGNIKYHLKERLQKSTRMAETDDPYTLVSPAKHPMEMEYAKYASDMKALANKARKEMMSTGKIEYSANAKATYKAEYDSLMDKLNTALLNSTRERAALRKANYEVSLKKEADPTLKPGDIKKISQQALTSKRSEVGSVSRRDRNINITDREWEAIQSGAISENKLKQILDNTDIDKLRERATPRTTTALSTSKINRAKAMSASNHSLSEIATALGVSTSTVSKILKGEK